MNNFQIANADTDSISFCKKDGSFIPKIERESLIKEINGISPEFMLWADDGYYKKVIIVAGKNYILQDEKGKLKIKGSGLKAPGKEKALREFIKEVIDCMLEDRNDYVEIYKKYAKEIINMKDISRWVSRKTISSKTLTSQRSNETKIVDAIKGTEIVEGNRAYFFFKSDDSLSLLENFDGDYSIDKLLKKLYDTGQVFDAVLNMEMFPNLSLKRNKGLLEQLSA